MQLTFGKLNTRTISLTTTLLVSVESKSSVRINPCDILPVNAFVWLGLYKCFDIQVTAAIKNASILIRRTDGRNDIKHKWQIINFHLLPHNEIIKHEAFTWHALWLLHLWCDCDYSQIDFFIENESQEGNSSGMTWYNYFKYNSRSIVFFFNNSY